MNQYLTKLISELEKYGAEYTVNGEDSVLELLWQCYAETRPVDDGRIRAAEFAIRPVFQALPLKDSDDLSNLVADLCLAYQRAAFLEGIQVGACLKAELAA